jgi:hypothetical protein
VHRRAGASTTGGSAERATGPRIPPGGHCWAGCEPSPLSARDLFTRTREQAPLRQLLGKAEHIWTMRVRSPHPPGFDFAHSPPPNPGSWFWGGAEALVHEDCTPPGPGGSRVRGGGGDVAEPRCGRSAIGIGSPLIPEIGELLANRRLPQPIPPRCLLPLTRLSSLL